MTTHINFEPPERRTRAERRVGLGELAEHLLQSDRSGGEDWRRTRARFRLGPGVSNWVYGSLALAMLCFVDIFFFNGDHSVQVVIYWGKYLDAVTGQWIRGALGQ
jgi:hypothetical protein